MEMTRGFCNKSTPSTVIFPSFLLHFPDSFSTSPPEASFQTSFFFLLPSTVNWSAVSMISNTCRVLVELIVLFFCLMSPLHIAHCSVPLTHAFMYRRHRSVKGLWCGAGCR
ncbi:hypothetical protein XENTR_v10013529 [Xenopus tropicalis]|nr:hypothetical protein XENTR_v10013529 [Xenopus tropicalis]